MSEYFGIIGTAPSGSTSCMLLVSGRKKAAEEAESLVLSDHTVRMFKCVPVEFEIEHTAMVRLEGE